MCSRSARNSVCAMTSIGTTSTTPPPVARGLTPVQANINDNLRRLANNPSTLGNLLRAQPVFVSGALKGYRIYPGRDRQQFARLGLQPGDLVTAVNGTPLDDPNRGNEILNTLISSTNAVVVVERNGVSQQVVLDMTQVNFPEPETDNSGPRADAAAPAGTPSAPVPANPF